MAAFEFRLERERRATTRTTCARLVAEHDTGTPCAVLTPPHATEFITTNFVRRLKRLAAKHEHTPTRAVAALEKAYQSSVVSCPLFFISSVISIIFNELLVPRAQLTADN